MGSKLWRVAAVLTVAALNGLAAYGCSGSTDTASTGVDGGSTPESCADAGAIECPTPAPTYADVAPVFEKKCVTCHSGAAGGPWPLTDYGLVSSWQPEIGGALVDCSMPPADAGAPLTEAERMLVLEWLQCGAPQ